MTRLVGINHVTLEMADLQRSLDCYRRIFDLRCAAAPNTRRSSPSATSSSR